MNFAQQLPTNTARHYFKAITQHGTEQLTTKKVIDFIQQLPPDTASRYFNAIIERGPEKLTTKEVMNFAQQLTTDTAGEYFDAIARHGTEKLASKEVLTTEVAKFTQQLPPNTAWYYFRAIAQHGPEKLASKEVLTTEVAKFTQQLPPNTARQYFDAIVQHGTEKLTTPELMDFAKQLGPNAAWQYFYAIAEHGMERLVSKGFVTGVGRVFDGFVTTEAMRSTFMDNLLTIDDRISERVMSQTESASRRENEHVFKTISTIHTLTKLSKEKSPHTDEVIKTLQNLTQTTSLIETQDVLREQLDSLVSEINVKKELLEQDAEEKKELLINNALPFTLQYNQDRTSYDQKRHNGDRMTETQGQAWEAYMTGWDAAETASIQEKQKAAQLEFIKWKFCLNEEYANQEHHQLGKAALSTIETLLPPGKTLQPWFEEQSFTSGQHAKATIGEFKNNLDSQYRQAKIPAHFQNQTFMDYTLLKEEQNTLQGKLTQKQTALDKLKKRGKLTTEPEQKINADIEQIASDLFITTEKIRESDQTYQELLDALDTVGKQIQKITKTEIETQLTQLQKDIQKLQKQLSKINEEHVQQQLNSLLSSIKSTLESLKAGTENESITTTLVQDPETTSTFADGRFAGQNCQQQWYNYNLNKSQLNFWTNPTQGQLFTHYNPTTKKGKAWAPVELREMIINGKNTPLIYLPSDYAAGIHEQRSIINAAFQIAQKIGARTVKA